jgi:hypothetical protein
MSVTPLMPCYNLSENPEFAQLLDTTSNTPVSSKFITVSNYSTKSNEKYRIVKYDKSILPTAQVSSYGLFRSVILNSLNNVVGFAPPKSLLADKFMEMYSSPTDKNIIAQEFIEGTMINVFFDPSVGLTGCWQIATRSTVGANISFFKGATKTFNDMFMEACAENKLIINTLNPMFCYSFVLQHPCNRIVLPFSKPQLYLVDVFQIVHDNGNIKSVKVYPQNMSIVKQYGFWGLTTIRFPEIYEFTTYSELIEKFASPNTPYNIMGIVIKNCDTNERCKIRNPIYEEVRQLRGNQPKMQYQYLCLRQAGKIPEFLKFYPETKNELSGYRDQLHMFTNTLFKNYISCYVKKENPLNQYPEQYRTHMFKIHEHYLTHLREAKGSITNTYVIEYVNTLPPSLLMFCLNHSLRKRNVDVIKTCVK